MKHKLNISKSFSLPLEAVTQTFAILAKKGKGKSYTASVMAEEMLKMHQHVVVLDPTGAWWGLQSSADGKSAGFPVVVFGGDHANVPLEESAGEVIAQAIIEKRFSAIIDLSLFRKGQANRFVAIFLENLYRLNRNPIHLFVDEADAFAPQKSFTDEARTLGAMEDIVRRGRKRGIGCTMITQRPAVINKNVLTQCEVLIALGMSHPKDIDAIEEWVNVHADKDQADQMISVLPTLPIGTAWFWSPGWLDVFQEIKIRMRETFDSGATPKPGERIKTPKKLAAIDIVSLGKSIEETVEQKKAEDPRELKKKIAELQKQISQQKPADTKELNSARQELKAAHLTINQYKQIFSRLQDQLSKFSVIEVTPSRIELPTAVIRNKPELKPQARQIIPKNSEDSTDQISGPERKILVALAQMGRAITKTHLAILTGYKHSGGGFNNPLSKLRTRGFITGSTLIEITDDGMMNVGEFEPIPTGKDLHNYWLTHLPGPESKILNVLLKHHPQGITKQQLADEAGYNPGGGGFNNPLSKLRTLQLADGKDPIKASDLLFQ